MGQGTSTESGGDHTAEKCRDKIVQNFVKYAKKPEKSLEISNEE